MKTSGGCAPRTPRSGENDPGLAAHVGDRVEGRVAAVDGEAHGADGGAGRAQGVRHLVRREGDGSRAYGPAEASGGAGRRGHEEREGEDGVGEQGEAHHRGPKGRAREERTAPAPRRLRASAPFMGAGRVPESSCGGPLARNEVGLRIPCLAQRRFESGPPHPSRLRASLLSSGRRLIVRRPQAKGMAKGYPTRPPEPDPLARFELPAPDVCIICKRRSAGRVTPKERVLLRFAIGLVVAIPLVWWDPGGLVHDGLRDNLVAELVGALITVAFVERALDAVERRSARQQREELRRKAEAKLEADLHALWSLMSEPKARDDPLRRASTAARLERFLRDLEEPETWASAPAGHA